MPDTTEPVRAPQGAIGWTPALGWVYDVAELPTRVEDGHFVLVVTDGHVFGVSGTATAPLVALLRLDADVTELTLSLHDIAEHVAGRLAGRSAMLDAGDTGQADPGHAAGDA